MTIAPNLRPALLQPGPSIRLHVVQTLRLALPVMVARAGLLLMIALGTIMTSRAGADQLAYFAISMAPHFSMLAIAIGLLVGTAVLTAQADGAGRPLECGVIWHMALIAAGCLGLLYFVITFFGEGLLTLTGQSPAIAKGGGAALFGFGFGMPAILMFVATSFFLEGIGRPRPGMIIALGANLVNAGLNWLLIYGNWGCPALGAEGAAISISLTRWAMFGAIGLYVFTMREGPHYGIRRRSGESFRTILRLMRLGAPLAFTSGLETTSFAATATFAGWLGATALAAYQVTLNSVSFVYMMAIGLSTATGVRVANAVGRGDSLAMARAGWVGLGCTVVLMSAIGVAIGVFRGGIAAIYTDDPAVVSLALPALAVGAAVVVFDGAQGVLAGAIRGIGDVILPAGLYLASFWGAMVPLAWWLGISAGGGIRGLMIGMLVGLAATAFLLALRFWTLTGRQIRPI